MASNESNRLAELKAFDETKEGVKGLVDAGVSSIPPIFIHPLSPALCPSPTTHSLSIPVIDLGGIEKDSTERKETIERIRDACDKWGFFQVVNHGIPIRVLDDMLEGIRGFFEQDVDVKKGYYSRDYDKKKVVYNSNFDLYTGLAPNWRDSIYFVMAPEPPNPQDLPSSCREIIMEYSDQVMKLANKLLELLSEVLGLEADHLKNIGCADRLAMVGHYYPACPQPELTIGTAKHSDNHFITVLLQDQIGGLQVLHDDQWVDVPTMHGALVINIADLLQLVSNDKLKSVEHRVLANKVGPRVSIASFLSNLYHHSPKLYGPIKKLLSESDPPKYRETTLMEYITFFRNSGFNGTSALQHFKL